MPVLRKMREKSLHQKTGSRANDGGAVMVKCHPRTGVWDLPVVALVKRSVA